MQGSYRTADGKAQIDWELKDTDNGPEFSACGEMGGSSGQCLDAIAAAYPDDPIVQRMCDVWRLYHLNGMNAGVPSQEAAIAAWKADGNQYDYNQAVMMLTACGKLVVPVPAGCHCTGDFDQELRIVPSRDHSCVCGKVRTSAVHLSETTQNLSGESDFCDCGKKFSRSSKVYDRVVHISADSDGTYPGVLAYRYGTRWVYGVIPDDVLNEILSWQNFPPHRPLHRDTADLFLARHGLRLRVTLSDSKTPAWNPEHEGHHYRVTLSRPAIKQTGDLARDVAATLRRKDSGASATASRLTFDFWGSLNDADNNRDPGAYQVLDSLASEATCPDTFRDFCSEFGYDEDSYKARQTYTRLKRFSDRVRAFFTDAKLIELVEIQ